MGRKKGQSQRNPLPPQASPRLPTGSWRRPVAAGIKHHVTASRRVPAGGPHCGAASHWKPGQRLPEPAPRTGILSNPPPTQVSRRQARPAPSPNTHSLAAPQQEQLAHPPHRCRSALTPMSHDPSPLRTSSRSQGLRQASALLSLLSGEDNGEKE